MKIKRINIGWSSMDGFGPAAWNQDRHILNMHAPHHTEHHQTEHTDDGGKAAADQDDVTTPRKEE